MNHHYRISIFSIVTFVLVIAAQTALAAPWEVGGKRMTKMNNAYDVTKVETITGKIVDIHEAQPSDAPNPGYHMVVKTEKEEVHAHLGPIWYIQDQMLLLQPGDMVTVICARVDKPEEHNGRVLRAVRASEVWKNSKLVLRLRDKSGKPLWSGL